MKYLRLLPWLVGLVLMCLAPTAARGQPLLRQGLTTNAATGTPVNGDVPTFDLATHKWTFAAPPGASGGEANVGANDSAGVGLYANKVGITLHFNTLTNTDGLIGISSNASLITFSFAQPNLYQHTNANLTLWQAIAPSAKQDASANLTSWSGLAPSAKQDASANLTLLSAYPPDTWQATNAVLTRLTALTDPNANRILVWDDTDNAFVNAVVGANLTYTHASHTLSSSGGTATTNFDLGSFNYLVVSNQLDVLGTMNLAELDVNDVIVTNNVQGSNLVANVATITPRVQSTNGANLVLAVNTTNVASAAAATGIMNFTLTPTVNGSPVLTNASGAAQTPYTSDHNAAGYWVTNLGGLTMNGGGDRFNFTTNIGAYGGYFTNDVSVGGTLTATNITTPVGAARLAFGVGTTNSAFYISGASANSYFNYNLEVVKNLQAGSLVVVTNAEIPTLTVGTITYTNKFIVGSLGCSFDGGGSVPSDNTTNYIVVPYTGYITGWNIVSDGASPTNQVDVLKIATGTALPSASICASALPALTTGNAVRSTAVSTWGSGTNLTAGDIVGFKFVHGAVGTKVTVQLETLH